MAAQVVGGGLGIPGLTNRAGRSFLLLVLICLVSTPLARGASRIDYPHEEKLNTLRSLSLEEGTAVKAVSLTGVVSLNGTSLIWVSAKSQEGHGEACMRHGLAPTSRDVFLPDEVEDLPTRPSGIEDNSSLLSTSSWSQDLLKVVANGLGQGLRRPGGIAGCCVSGMWCDPSGCWTMAFGHIFSNHGGYVNMPDDSYSVYTCYPPAQVTPPEASNSTHSSSSLSETHGDGLGADAVIDRVRTFPVIESASTGEGLTRPGQRLMLTGSNFGEDRSLVRVMVGGRECQDPDLCHRVCRPCSDDHRCDFDEMCVEDGLSKEKVCLPICDGSDGSCPCDHQCSARRFELAGSPHRLLVRLCQPRDAGLNSLCRGSTLRHQERIECTAPVLDWSSEEGFEADIRATTVGLSVTVGTGVGVWEQALEYGAQWCGGPGGDADCDDGDACTEDYCVEGVCQHKGGAGGLGCQAQPYGVMSRWDAYSYIQAVDEKVSLEEQVRFLSEVQGAHETSSVSKYDDYPVELYHWHTEFPLFGTKYQDVVISPNGALYMPPVQANVRPPQNCFGGLCPVSSFTEAYLPVLQADWNPADRDVLPGMASLVMRLVTPQQFSVLYQDVVLYKK
ncbi:unnamed protein product, partial [Discosporangium mesarthrocarpum]